MNAKKIFGVITITAMVVGLIVLFFMNFKEFKPCDVIGCMNDDDGNDEDDEFSLDY